MTLKYKYCNNDRQNWSVLMDFPALNDPQDGIVYCSFLIVHYSLFISHSSFLIVHFSILCYSYIADNLAKSVKISPHNLQPPPLSPLSEHRAARQCVVTDKNTHTLTAKSQYQGLRHAALIIYFRDNYILEILASDVK